VLNQQGQLRLKHSAVLVTRAGGMGGPAALALTMAGVGRVIIAHGGQMITPDLNRQILGNEAVVGNARAEAFGDYLQSMNRHVVVEALPYEPDDEQARQLATRVDAIIGCPPTFDERLRLNRAAVEAGIPYIDAAQWGMTGTIIVTQAPKSACLRCVYPEDPPFEELFPVVGAISMATGSLAALEAIKLLSKCGRPLLGKMLLVDAFHGATSLVQLQRDAICSVCGPHGTKA